MVIKALLWAVSAVLMLPIASACGGNGEPAVSSIPANIEEVVRAYFGAWEAGEFEEMFSMTTADQGGASDFADDMSFAPVIPKGLKIEGSETASANRTRVQYSLDLPEIKYIVAGLILINPARYGPGCALLNEERTQYISYRDFVVVEREDEGSPWKIDAAEGNTLVIAVRGMNGIVQTLYSGIRPPGVDPEDSLFDREVLADSLAIYALARELDETARLDLGEAVFPYVGEITAECR